MKYLEQSNSETESRMVFVRDGGARSGELLFNNCVSAWEDEKVLEIDGDEGWTTM